MGENNVERNRKVETREVEFRRSMPSCVVTSSMFQRQNLSQVWVWCRGDLNFYTCCTVPHMSYDIFRQQKATQQLRFTWECAQGLHLYSQKLSLNFTSILTKTFPQFHIHTHKSFPSIPHLYSQKLPLNMPVPEKPVLGFLPGDLAMEPGHVHVEVLRHSLHQRVPHRPQSSVHVSALSQKKTPLANLFRMAYGFVHVSTLCQSQAPKKMVKKTQKKTHCPEQQ